MEEFELIQKIIDGDQEAYSEIVIKYKDRIFQLCYSMLSDAASAEDAAQEIFIKAYQKLNRFKYSSSFFTWLYRIASNHCLDLLRARSRHKTESLDSLIEKEGDKINDFFAASPNSQKLIADKEIVQKILSLLSPEYRLILTLREVEGMSYQEIAGSLHCSLDAVKARLKRAREDFEKKFRHFSASENV